MGLTYKEKKDYSYANFHEENNKFSKRWSLGSIFLNDKDTSYLQTIKWISLITPSLKMKYLNQQRSSHQGKIQLVLLIIIVIIIIWHTSIIQITLVHGIKHYMQEIRNVWSIIIGRNNQQQWKNSWKLYPLNNSQANITRFTSSNSAEVKLCWK